MHGGAVAPCTAHECSHQVRGCTSSMIAWLQAYSTCEVQKALTSLIRAPSSTFSPGLPRAPKSIFLLMLTQD
eukprot:1158134-Pelagomonas_calceolata.AAC.1